ncbi:MAG: SGNH/GDSL hydrolase family protein [Phycisphaerales bacterium]|jgi:hypothetical protein|nr:SGNH/GDSL hydrolase family protein [Phycisphaerales bacterium]
MKKTMMTVLAMVMLVGVAVAAPKGETKAAPEQKPAKKTKAERKAVKKAAKKAKAKPAAKGDTLKPEAGSAEEIKAVKNAKGSAKKTAKKKRRTAYTTVTDVKGLPRVLIIGDSISIGYTMPTQDLLKGKVNVHRIGTNAGPTTRGLANIDEWIGKGKWDVIHFNWGLHDLKYIDAKGNLTAVAKGKQQISTADYEKNLTKLVQRLKKTGAKLVFATTTPVPEGSKGRIVGDSVKYNAVALKIMKAEGIVVNDLYTFIKPTLATAQNKANVHFTSIGSKALAGEVANCILTALGKDPLPAPKPAKAKTT